MNDSKSESSQFWSRLWSWVRNISTLVVLTYTFVQLVNALLPTSEYDIVAYGDCVQLAFPDSFYQELDDLRNSIDADKIAEILPITDEDKEEEWYNLPFSWIMRDYSRSMLASTVTDYMRDNYPFTLEAQLNRLHSIWWFTIKNEGTKEVNDLTLELPFDGLFRIERSGEVPFFSDFEKNIQIGSLRPSREIRIIVWSKQDVSYPWRLQSIKNETRITHPNGIIDITYPEKVTGVLAWLARTIGFRGSFLGLLILTFVSLGLLGILALGIHGAYQAGKEMLKEAPSKEQASGTLRSEEEPSDA